MLVCIFFAVFMITGMGAMYNALALRKESRRYYYRVHRLLVIRFRICMTVMMIAAGLTFFAAVSHLSFDDAEIEVSTHKDGDVSLKTVELKNQADSLVEGGDDSSHVVVFIPYI